MSTILRPDTPSVCQFHESPPTVEAVIHREWGPFILADDVALCGDVRSNHSGLPIGLPLYYTLDIFVIGVGTEVIQLLQLVEHPLLGAPCRELHTQTL